MCVCVCMREDNTFAARAPKFLVARCRRRRLGSTSLRNVVNFTFAGQQFKANKGNIIIIIIISVSPFIQMAKQDY